MELRRAAQMLFRSQSLFSPSLLANASPRAAGPFTSARRATPSFTCQSCRQFSIQTRLRKDEYDPNAPLKGIQNISLSPEKESGNSLEDFGKPFSWSRPDRKYPDTYKPKFENRYSAASLLFPDDGQGSTYADNPLPKERVLTELPIRLTARTGRTFDVDPGKNKDLGVRLRQLEMLCSRNKIKNDFNKQRFHERPGLKRKRLKSQRWRIRFKNEFKKTVSRVVDLRKKGW
jgi:ribosomal protein S21